VRALRRSHSIGVACSTGRGSVVEKQQPESRTAAGTVAAMAGRRPLWARRSDTRALTQSAAADSTGTFNPLFFLWIIVTTASSPADTSTKKNPRRNRRGVNRSDDYLNNAPCGHQDNENVAKTPVAVATVPQDLRGCYCFVIAATDWRTQPSMGRLSISRVVPRRAAISPIRPVR
jgi:hypothetical protein